MKVINITGTADKTCTCGSWLDHWRKFSGQAGVICGVVGCNRTDMVGAHVMKVGVGDYATYIYPLCKEHNQSTETMDVWDGYNLVSANKAETCEKPSRSLSGGLYS
jgi:hypothetical protein